MCFQLLCSTLIKVINLFSGCIASPEPHYKVMCNVPSRCQKGAHVSFAQTLLCTTECVQFSRSRFCSWGPPHRQQRWLFGRNIFGLQELLLVNYFFSITLPSQHPTVGFAITYYPNGQPAMWMGRIHLNPGISSELLPSNILLQGNNLDSFHGMGSYRVDAKSGCQPLMLLFKLLYDDDPTVGD